jgi:hypothetical protein
MKQLIKNRKGTAEVIGTMLFIVILLFFFTNVYLWHDTATKQANQLYLKKISSTFQIHQVNGVLVVTANGGSTIDLSRLWIIDNTLNEHYYADLGNVQVAAGESFNITFSSNENYYNPASPITPVTIQGGIAQVSYYAPTGYNVTCTVVNTLGVTESTIFLR